MKYLLLLILLSGCVSHRPRYNHWAKPYKIYEPVKTHKPIIIKDLYEAVRYMAGK